MQIEKLQGHTHKGQHECAIFPGKDQEATECQYEWDTCNKNPGHSQFITVPDFVNKYLPQLKNLDTRVVKKLKAMLDLTVRVRLRRTSLERPVDDDFAQSRGTNQVRMGTGFIYPATPAFDEHSSLKFNGPCPCLLCKGKVWKTHYRFCVQTALHVVYNTEEAKWAKVDLFYDDEASWEDGRMKTVMGMRVLERDPDHDYCVILCITHDEEVGRRLQIAFEDQDYSITRPFFACLFRPVWCYSYLFEAILDREASASAVLVMSHPHGQPKRITTGVLASEWHVWNSQMFYSAHTCPGCSGAPVFRAIHLGQERFSKIAHVHTGSCRPTESKEFSLSSFILDLGKYFSLLDEQKNYCYFNAPSLTE